MNELFLSRLIDVSFRSAQHHNGGKFLPCLSLQQAIRPDCDAADNMCEHKFEYRRDKDFLKFH